MVGPNVVRDFQIGNTRVRIADNYCKKTASEVERILQRIASQAQRQFNAAAATGNYEQEQDTQISATNRQRSDRDYLCGGRGSDHQPAGDRI